MEIYCIVILYNLHIFYIILSLYYIIKTKHTHIQNPVFLLIDSFSWATAR